MKGLFKKSISKVYILCPNNKVTGGTEALHQLRYYMELLGINAFLVYFNDENEYSHAEVPSRYHQYITNKDNILFGDEIEDCKENCVVAPEFSTSMLWRFKNVKKVIWWLSVRFYDGGSFMRYLSIRHWLKESIKKPNNFLKYKQFFNPYDITDVIHCCASQYAYEFVTLKLKQDAYKLIEPISKDFLVIGPETEMSKERKNKVAYNPAKPSKIMKKLLDANQFEFIPIKNMTPSQISDTMREVKLYVDFGEFPGPERIPKEAVYNGAEIIVGKRNAAVNGFDINIPEKYKIEQCNNFDIVTNKIKEMLEQYEVQYEDFGTFRNQICDLEKKFMESINYIWGDENE